MKYCFIIFCLSFTTLNASFLPKWPDAVLRDLEMMYGGKFPVEKLSRGILPIFDAYRDVEFELYTQKNPREHQRIFIDDATSLIASNFNPSHPTRFLIHGCCTNGSSESIQYPREGYMNKGEYNVFGVNWAKGAGLFPIRSYEKRMKDVGETVAKFIYFLIREGGASMRDMGVIGHSAGAVTVSFVGKSTNGTLPVQISLDPPKSYSYFIYGTIFPQKTDAKYVEVMHTAADESNMFIHLPLGHADFYPNGGRYQPYCYKVEESQQDHCNHMIAIAYFAESIQSKDGFWSKKCKNFEGILEGKCDSDGSYKKMGGEPINTTEGVYYLETGDDFPFAQGMIH